MQRSHPVYYWDGIVDPHNLTAEYAETVQQLMNGEYRELKLEKLHGYNVYSIRLNRSDRMLFTTIDMNGASYVMVLDIVLNHDYHKSPFLKPGVLKNYLELNGEAFKDALIREDDFIAHENLNIPTASTDAGEATQCNYVPVECFQQRFIIFSADQDQIAKREKLPLVINGAAGSGKSCVALSMLAHYVARHGDKLVRPLVYVTESEKLCASMFQNWCALPIAHKVDRGMIQFKTYHQLVMENDQAAAELKVVGKTECFEFIRERIKSKRNQDKAVNRPSFTNAFFKNVEVMYQEFRIISGCHNWDVYKNLGAKQSLVDQQDQRKWLYDEYEHYLSFLSHSRCIDVGFYRAKLANKFQLVVVDESQDFSHLQLEVLCDSAFQSQICYCEDARQSLADNLPKKTFFGRLLDAQNRKVTFKELALTYRCPASVVRIANGVLDLGGRLSGQRQASAMLPDVNQAAGAYIWLDELTDDRLALLLKEAETPGFAVVTRSEWISRAKKIFNTELVFTVEEIKGLEYQTVLVYRLLNNTIYYEANNLLATMSAQGDKLLAADKFGPPFNALYTACTRSTESLIVLQDCTETRHKLRHLTDHLRAYADKAEVKVVRPVDNKSAAESWFAEVKKQISQGNIEIARSIYIKQLEMTNDDFDQLLNILIEPVVQEVKVTAPKQSKRNKHKKKSKKTVVVSLPAVKRIDRAEINRLLRKSFLTDNDCKKLFEPIKERGGDCEFSLLFEDSDLRCLVADFLIPKHHEQIVRFMTAKSLCSEQLSDKIPSPLYFISRCEASLCALSKNEAFSDLLVSVATDHQQVLLGCTFNLSCFDAGISLLGQVIRSLPVLCHKLNQAMLLASGRGPYGFMTSIFYNLLLSKDGLPVIQYLLDEAPHLFNELPIRALFPRVPNHMMPRLFDLLSCKQGSAVLLGLRKQSSAIDKTLEHTINPYDMVRLHEVLNGDQENDADIDAKIDSLKILMSRLDHGSPEVRRQLLESFMAQPVAHSALFSVPLSNGECLFTNLFDLKSTRGMWLSEILPKHAFKLTQYVTVSALSRVSPASTLPPPILWMLGSECGASVLLGWIENNQRIMRAINPYAALSKMPLAQYYKSGLPDSCNAFKNSQLRPVVGKDVYVSALSLALLTNPGRTIFSTFMVNAQFSRLVSINDMLENSLLDVAKKEKTSPFLIYSKSDVGLHVLSEIFKYQDLRVIDEQALVDTLCHGVNIVGNDYYGHCCLLDMLLVDKGKDILVLIMVRMKLSRQSLLVKMIFNALTENVTGDSISIKILVAISNDNYLVEAVVAYLAHNPEIYKTFNKNMFSDILSKLDGVTYSIRMTVLNCTRGGRKLFDFITRSMLMSESRINDDNVSMTFFGASSASTSSNDSSHDLSDGLKRQP